MRLLLELERLSFAYEGKSPVFTDVSFELPGGSVCALMGGNGSGKTTLLNCICAGLNASSGTVRANGSDIASLSRRECAKLMSVVPQEHATVFPYTVSNMVLMGRAPYIPTLAMPGEDDVKKAMDAMEEVGIAGLADCLFTEISGGERQLCLIARALAQDAPIMLLDEPTSHLDFRNQIRALEVITRLVRRKGILALIATHDPNHALGFADRVMILHKGVIVANGRPEEIINRETINEVYGVDVTEVRKDGRVAGVIPENPDGGLR